MRWCIDVAYGVHLCIKIHYGGMLLLGKWAMQINSSKNKLNTRIST